jgi:uncharacterized membrane protein YhaH (DUF805 family)
LGLFSFWWGVLAIGVFLDKIIPNHFTITIIPTFLLGFLALTNIIFIKIRRLNDFNYSGWWMLLGGIPVLGTLWILAIFCISGTDGNNRFGPASSPSGWNYLLILAAPLIYLILYLFGIYDLT